MKLLSLRKQFAIIFILTLLAGVGAQTQPRFVTGKNSGPAGTPYVDRQVIVKLDDNINASAIAAVRSSVNAKVLKRFSSIGAELWQISDETVEAAIARYRQDPRIKYVEPNYRVALIQQRIERFPNDPRLTQMWGLHNTGQTNGTNDADIDAPEAWDIETGNEVLIGVIDTGVDWTHEDLAANIWVNTGEIPNNGLDDDGNGYIDDVRGWDFVNNDNNPIDDEGHGSHVSGTIAAVGNNGVGTVGVSWSAKIMALKFLDANGSGTIDGAISAVEYATRNRARLTSNSWGGGDFSQALYDAIAVAGSAGILFVAAAGNDGDNTDLLPHYPSTYDLDNIISVAATDHDDRLASFSNFGVTSVDLGAPGVNILSTFPGNNYGSISGTSMATPHVSGAISLIWSRVPGLTHLRVKELLLQNVDPLPSLQGRMVSGGRLNAFKALQTAEPDSIAPAAVADLATADPKSNFITLTWIASGDDGDSGKAAAYDIRYSTSPINSVNFATAIKASATPAPKPAGDSESFAVGGLNFNTTYYFALKVLDEQGNASEVSNSPSGTTLGIPVIAVTPDSLADSLLTGAQSTQALTISNTGEGTLDFNITVEGEIANRASVSVKRSAFQRYAGAPRISEFAPPDRLTDGARGSTVGAKAVSLPFYDGFEDGDFKEWINDGGNGIKEVTTATAAKGRHSFHYRYTGFDAHSHGIHQDFDAGSQPEEISLYIRSGSTTTADAYAVFYGNGGINLVMYIFASNTGFFNVNGDESFAYNALQWYHVAFKDINWADKSFDFYVDGQLISENIPFRDTGINDIDRLYIYNFHTNSEAWWDEINVGNATVPARWLTAAPDSGTVFAGSSFDIDVTFDATGLSGGAYTANLVIASNDPDSSTLKIPARLFVIGAPDIALSDSVFDFGARIIGDTATAKLTVSNFGTDALTVTSIASDNGDYAAAPDTFTVHPNDSREVLVRFMPSTEGNILGVLTITTNDPDEPVVAVALRGRGVLPPEIAVAPDSLRENLFTGQTAKQILTIANTGLSDLFFEIAVENINVIIPLSVKLKNAALAGKVADGKSEHAEKPITAAISKGARNRDDEWTRKILRANEQVAAATGSPIIESNSAQAAPTASFLSADEIWRQRRQNAASNTTPVYAVVLDGVGTLDPLSRMWDELNANWPRFGDEAILIDYSTFHAVDITYAGLAASGADVVIVSNNWNPTQPYGPFSEAEARAIVQYVNEGAGLYISGGTFNNGIYPELQFQVTYLAPLVGLSATERYTWNGNPYGSLNFTVPDHPVLRNIPAPFTSGWQFDTLVPLSGAWTAAAIPTGTLVGISTNQQTVLVVNGNRVYHSSLPDHASGTEADKQFLYNAITLTGGASWVSADPLTGTVPPNSQTEIEVTFDATGLTGGDYTADLVVTNNDPDEKRTLVPVHLQVTGAADIATAQDTLDFGEVFIGAKKSVKFAVQNKGSLDLLIFSAVAAPAVYTVKPAFAGIDPGEEEIFTVSFSPQAVADYPGTLTFTSNDPDEPAYVATLLGRGVIPPDIATLPDSLRADLFTGADTTQILTISNRGGSNLIFDILIESIQTAAAPASINPSRHPDDKVIVRTDFTPEETAAGKTVAPMQAAQAVKLPFHDGFESGNFNRWIDDGGMGVKEVTRATAAIGRYSFHYRYTGSGSDHFHGIHQEFERGSQPEYIGFHVRSGSTTAADGYFVLMANQGNTEAIWFFANINGFFYVNADVGGNNSHPYRALQWYHIEFKNIDWTAKNFDYYVDGALVKADIPFRNASIVNDIDRLYLYNFQAGSEAWWDDVAIGEPPTSWLTATPASGVVPPDSSIEIQAKFDAAGLNGGDYFANLVITNNDPDADTVKIPAHLRVTGAPVIAVSKDTLDYGAIFIGASVIDTLIISNVGTALLSVTDISAALPQFEVNPTKFDLNPEEQQAVVVTFKPDTVQEFSSQLTITSNDLKRSTVVVALLGTGIVAPDIAVAPDSLDESLFTGETSTQILTISNSGGSDLKFEISFEEASATAAVNIKNHAGFSSAASKNTFFQRQQSLSQLQQEIPGEVLARTSSYGAMAQTLPKRLVSAAQAADILLLTTAFVRESVEQILNNLGKPYDFLQTQDFTGIDFSPYKTLIVAMDGGFITEASVQALANAAASGKKLIMLGGTSLDPYYQGVQAFLLSHTGEQGWVISQTPHLRITDPAHPLSADLPLNNNYNSSFCAYYMLRVNDPQASVAAINGDGHPILLNKKIGDGVLIYFTSTPHEAGWGNAADFAILQTVIGNALDFSGTMTWLSANPDFGAVPAGDSMDVVVTFDATALKGGDYFANLVISSNDPDEHTLKVPAHLRVTGAPAIAVSDTILPFGEVFVGATAIDTLVVSSRGTDSLKVSSIAVDNTAYSASPTSFTLAPGENSAVEVIFTPSATGPSNGILTIVSNDKVTPQLQVTLAGEGVEPPVISITPAAFEFRMNAGDSATTVMTIANTGGSPLNFKIRDEEAPQTAASGGQKLYWTESLSAPDTLHRSNLDGTNVEALYTFTGSFGGIAVDEPGGRIYWTDYGAQTIRSSNLEGSDVRVLITRAGIAVDIAIDPTAGKIYWTDFGAGTINRANLDGSGAGVIVQNAGTGARSVAAAEKEVLSDHPATMRADENAAALVNPWAIALDLTHGKLYWTELSGNRLGRANLDGSGVETIIASGLNGPRGLRLDIGNGKLYFIDSFSDVIKRANLNGSQVETILQLPGNGNPLNIDLDLEARQFYWTDNAFSQIQRANFDGSNVQVIVNSNRANAPFGIGLSLGTGWLTETPNSGTIAAGSSQGIEIEVDAGTLANGNYSANILVESDDPKNKVVTVPVKLQVAAGDLLIAIADTLHGVPNETVDVPVYLTLNEDSLAVAALGATVKATNKILAYIDFTPGPIIPDTSLRVISPTSDSVRLAFLAANGQNITQSGLLATLRFKIASNAPVGQTALFNFNLLTAADSSAKPLSFSADNGMLKVNKAPALSGRVQYAGAVKPAANLTTKLTQNGALVQETKTDAGGNYVLGNIIPGANYRVQVSRASGGIGAAITPTDALMALRASLSGAQKLAADVDGNLAVESKDAMMIFDFFLGLIAQFPVEAWRTFPANYNLDATPDAWKTAPNGIDYPSLRSDLTNQNYLAVVRGDVDLDWPPSAAASSQPLARLAGSSSGNSEALLQFAATNAVVVSGAKTMTWQVRLDGAALQKGVYAFGVELRYDASALEITQIRWGKAIPTEGFRLNYRILPAAEKSETETLTGRLRFGGFSTAAAAIRAAGVLIEIDAQLRADLAAGASLPIRLAEVSAAVGAAPGLSKSNGTGGFTGATITVVDGAVQVVAIPTDFALQKNYPNPFNPATRIQYQLPEAATVKLEIFNALGQRVRTLVNSEQQPAGYYNLEWNGRNDAEITVPSGVYFYRFEAKGAAKTFAKTQKMLLVK